MNLFKTFIHRILPHEFLWLFYLGLQTGLLFRYVGFSGWSLFSAAMMILVVGLVFCHRPFVRLGAYILIMNGMFNAVEYISPLINPMGHKDALLNQIDTTVFGQNLSVALEPFAHPLITEILSLAYMLFMVQLFFRSCCYLVDKAEVCQRFFVGLMSLYAVGFIGYILIPAYGPYLYLKESFSDPLNAWFFRDLLNWAYPKGTNYTDVFPSLHCGVSLLILGADYFYHRRWFHIFAPICILLWFSTIYLRYHYTIDCVAGFALAGGCLYLMKHYTYKKGD